MKVLKDKYTLDAPYTWGFYYNQSPTLIDYVARLKGLKRRPFDKPFNYLELGCGNGLTCNVLAAALPESQFTAVDISPQHMTNARRIAKKAELTNVTFIEKSFEDFLRQKKPPQFDYITLHGVYTWVSAEIRQEILKVIDKMLKPRGLVFVSYNAMPGWAELLPLRQMMISYTASMKENSLTKAAQGIKYLQYLRDNKSPYFKKHPNASKFLDKMAKEDLHYIVHEYFNESWEPLYFSEVASDMKSVGLVYCDSTELIRNYSEIVSPPFRVLLDKAKTAVEYEIQKSLILNEFFRCDMYCKKSTIAALPSKADLLSNTIIGGKVTEKNIQRKVTFSQGIINYNSELSNKLIKIALDGTRTIGEICEAPSMKKHKKEEIITTIKKLLAGGQFQVFATKAPAVNNPTPNRFQICASFNKIILKERLLKDSKCPLSSPVSGSGIPINLMGGLMLMAGHKSDPVKIVERALHELQKSKKLWRRGGRVIVDPRERQQLLEQELKIFRERWMPVLLRYGIIEPF